MRKSNLLAMCVALMFGAAQAASIEQPLQDPAQEAQAREIFSSLKCVVCEGQSLAESDAKLAAQMREAIRGMVAEGKSQNEILNYFRTRYGEQILLTPPMERNTYLLWLAPIMMLAVGAYVVGRHTKQGDNHG